jgi:CTP synthase
LNHFFPFSILFNRSERQLDEVVIALVGKYTGLEDAYASVLKALNHAALFCKRKLSIRVRRVMHWLLSNFEM